VRVEVIDEGGKIFRPINGADVKLGVLEARNLALPLSAPSAVRIRSSSAATSLCVARVFVGGPFVTGS
jgi:hypothetical protein